VVLCELDEENVVDYERKWGGCADEELTDEESTDEESTEEPLTDFDDSEQLANVHTLTMAQQTLWIRRLTVASADSRGN